MISLKNYYQQTSVKVKKFGLWLKGMIGLVSGTAYVQNDVRLALYALVTGAVITGLLELLPPDSNNNTNSNSSTPGIAGSVTAILAIAMLFCYSCTVVKPEVDRTKSDSTITSYKQVDLNIKGAKVGVALNLDSLMHVALMSRDQHRDDSLAGIAKYVQDSTADAKAHKPIPAKQSYIPPAPKKQYVTDPQTKAELSYWIDAYGKFQIQCESKDQLIQTLQAQVTKLTTDKTVTTKVVVQTPAWNKWLMIAESIAILVLAIILVIKTIL